MPLRTPFGPPTTSVPPEVMICTTDGAALADAFWIASCLSASNDGSGRASAEMAARATTPSARRCRRNICGTSGGEGDGTHTSHRTHVTCTSHPLTPEYRERERLTS